MVERVESLPVIRRVKPVQENEENMREGDVITLWKSKPTMALGFCAFPQPQPLSSKRCSRRQ